jgi:hypothetical protein
LNGEISENFESAFQLLTNDVSVFVA